MPAVITHYLMGQAALKKMNDPWLKTLISKNMDAFSIGAQGPDILFFALGDKELNLTGNAMHESGISSFYSAAIAAAKSAVEESKDIIISYMCGFLCHYALDTCTHPYIYFKTGFTDDKGSLKDMEKKRHRFLETTIDCLLCEKLGGMSPYKMNISKKILVAGKGRKVISQFLSQTIQAAYGLEKEPADYAKAMKDMAFIYRLFRDKSGRRRALASFAGKLFRDSGATAALIHYSDVKESVDYLNMDHNLWCFPWDEDIELNLSFMDLYNRAVDDAQIYVNSFAKAVKGTLETKIALSILGGKNFSTGLESPVRFLYYNKEFARKKK
ncbi:MAG: zinc dependent phospholipase C family protein [Clostridiales bacterium]|jgi:hypothetical protein|nr:zinc dependent phospholipase C family protein [Clostridiales bacterium]